MTQSDRGKKYVRNDVDDDDDDHEDDDNDDDVVNLDSLWHIDVLGFFTCVIFRPFSLHTFDINGHLNQRFYWLFVDSFNCWQTRCLFVPNEPPLATQRNHFTEFEIVRFPIIRFVHHHTIAGNVEDIVFFPHFY